MDSWKTNRLAWIYWLNGRGGEIRTHDLLYPKQARYQATLRPDTNVYRCFIVPQLVAV